MSKYVKVGLCNVVKGWAGSCVIIIEKLRKRAYKSQMIPVGLMVDCTCAMTAVLLSANIALRGRQVTRRRAGQQSTPFNSANRSLGSIFWLESSAKPLRPLTRSWMPVPIISPSMKVSDPQNVAGELRYALGLAYP